MAITRREFVTRLGAVAAAVGISQSQLSQLAQAWAHDTALGGMNTLGPAKPKVIWIHGAECTGCSTSLLGIFENLEGKALANPALSAITVHAALNSIVGPDTTTTGTTQLVGKVTDDVTPAGTGKHGHTTLLSAGLKDGSLATPGDGAGGLDPANSVNIADVVIDFISLEYHETVMGMGGDLAHDWLRDRMSASAEQLGPFVLVVEGAMQPMPVGDTGTPWCVVADDDAGNDDLQPAEVVANLAPKATAIIPIGQCACFGGYPACIPPVTGEAWTAAYGGKQTSAMGVYDFLKNEVGGTSHQKVINVPGCPTNPWWFILTVVLWMYDVVQGPGAATPGDGPLGIVKQNLSLNPAALDGAQRLNYVYGSSVHGPKCPRYFYYTGGIFAQQPGDPGCLLQLGCKGTTTNSLCSVHGWNNQQVENPDTWDDGVAAITTSFGKKANGFCTAAGHPCMGCTEKGYPDVNLPFVKL